MTVNVTSRRVRVSAHQDCNIPVAQSLAHRFGVMVLLRRPEGGRQAGNAGLDLEAVLTEQRSQPICRAMLVPGCFWIFMNLAADTHNLSACCPHGRECCFASRVFDRHAETSLVRR